MTPEQRSQMIAQRNTPAMQTNAQVMGRTPTTPAVPVPDMYNNYINQFQPVNPELANQYRTQFNGYNAFSDTANSMNNMYDVLTNQTNQLYGGFQRVNEGLDRDITGKLQNAFEQAQQQYGPEGTQTRRVEDYYRNLADNMAAQNAVNMGDIGAQAQASGASAGAQRNARSAAALDANTQSLQLQQQQLSDYDNIYKTLNEYYNAFIQNYGNSKNMYVRDTYAMLTDAMNQINQARSSTMMNLKSAEMEKRLRDEEMAKAMARQTGVDNSEEGIINVLKDANGQLVGVTNKGNTYPLTAEQQEIYAQQQLAEQQRLVNNIGVRL